MARLGKLLIVFCVALYAYHFYRFAVNLVDFPKLDDWILITPSLAESIPQWSWLSHVYCDHRYIVYKFLSWSWWHLGLRSFITYQIFGFILYGLLLASIGRILWDRFERRVALWASAFIPFLLLPMLLETHFWPLLMSVHLSYLFFFWGAYFLSHPRPSRRTELGAFVAIALCVGSDSNGVPLTVSLVVAHFFLNRRWRSTRTVLESLALLAPAALFFVGFTRNPAVVPSTYPNEPQFWRYLMTELSTAFGYVIFRPLSAGVAAITVLVPAIALLRARNLKTSEGKFLIAVLASLGSVLVALSVAKAADWNTEGVSKEFAMRYYEFCVYLLPFAAASVAWVLRERRIVQTFAVLLLGLFSLKGYSAHRFFQRYSECRLGRERTVGCIHDKVSRRERPICTQYSDRYLMPIYETDFTDNLLRAKALGFDFTRDLDLSYLDLKKPTEMN